MGFEDEIKIIFDSDVLRHFVDGNQIFMLSKIFPKKICIAKKVLNELVNKPKYRGIIEQFIKLHNIEIVQINENLEEISEYASLIKTMGKGEAECLVIAKYRKNYVASSNLSDIHNYCSKEKIKYYTTLDILSKAVLYQIMNEHQCNSLIQINISLGNKIPNITIEEYISRKLNNLP